jgi:hypothetical protein
MCHKNLIYVAHRVGVRHGKLFVEHRAVVRHKKNLFQKKNGGSDLDLGPPEFHRFFF